MAKKATRKKKTSGKRFQLTYATMFNPPEELHTRYERALRKVKADLGNDIPMLINGQDRFSGRKIKNTSPINTDWFLGSFQQATNKDVRDAIGIAQEMFPVWAGMKWQRRVQLLRRATDRMEKRLFEIAAVLSLEVGKNRMEALGDAQEAVDLIRYACDQMEANDGYIRRMNDDPLKGYSSTNWSVMKPYGVWVVISPFNFPGALSGGPFGAALVTGNTVVVKAAEDTPWTCRLLAECVRAAGIPDGVFNYLSGFGETTGQALVNDPRVAGLTFTGSYEVGMQIYRSFTKAPYPRPLVLEMGGKNPAIVTRNADLERAAQGIVRSAFGLSGQKCSACSRVLVETPVKKELTELILKYTDEMVTVGDPTERDNWMGPVINKTAYRNYGKHVRALRKAGRVLAGGKTMREGKLAKGYYCEPTVVDNVPRSHPLWQHEMFLPITMITGVKSFDQAMELANGVEFGLTAGMYGSKQEARAFYEQTQAGVNYVNRPQGATTGAWPGFQPFGGWKSSGATGKLAGGLYYLPMFMHEQIHNMVV